MAGWMRRFGRLQGLLVAVAMLAGCGNMDIDDFAGRSPPLVLEEFFAGRVEGWGILQSRFGTLRRQFRIEAEGEWDAGTRTLRLTETWRFDDGEEDVLDWTIRRTGPRSYEGHEPSLIGPARGTQAGNAFRWTYRRQAPSTGGTRLFFDDWFWLQQGGVLIARASVQRFGLEIATMSVFYRRVPPP